MKKIIQIAIFIILLGLAANPAKATFTSLYIFGDGTSTTTNNTLGNPNFYYGGRYSNGRVWVEVLAQRLGLGANSTTNANWSNANNDWSYFGQYSPNLVANVNHFVPPSDVKTALFIIWVNDADFVNYMATVYPSTDTNKWNAAISQSLTNHLNAINNLYGKGVRTLIMPNAVDVTEIPQYNGYPQASRNFVRQQVVNYNAQFATLLQQEQTALPGLTIYQPNFFGLLDNVITNASAYGLTNYQYGGVNSYALNQAGAAMNGPGSNYIFWDQTDPSAKLHEIMADSAVPLIAPVKINLLTVQDSSPASPSTNRLDVINVPVGLNGFVDGATNLGVIGVANIAWVTVTNINSTSVTQSLFVNAAPLPPVQLPGGNGSILPGSPGSGSNNSSLATNSFSPGEIQIYRLRFPLAWNWP